MSLSGAFQLFTNKAKGVGFLLPICERIPEADGRKIVVKSKIGKEIRVTVAVSVEPEPTGEGGEKWILNESAFKLLLRQEALKAKALLLP